MDDASIPIMLEIQPNSTPHHDSKTGLTVSKLCSTNENKNVKQPKENH
jgi:hypothetical protein